MRAALEKAIIHGERGAASTLDAVERYIDLYGYEATDAVLDQREKLDPPPLTNAEIDEMLAGVILRDEEQYEYEPRPCRLPSYSGPRSSYARIARERIAREEAYREDL